MPIPPAPKTEDFVLSSQNLSLRDYFAGQVLTHIYADFVASYNNTPSLRDPDWQWQDVLNGVAISAWEMADVMLAHREMITTDKQRDADNG